jgi:hypothetical protein
LRLGLPSPEPAAGLALLLLHLLKWASLSMRGQVVHAGPRPVAALVARPTLGP